MKAVKKKSSTKLLSANETPAAPALSNQEKKLCNLIAQSIVSNLLKKHRILSNTAALIEESK